MPVSAYIVPERNRSTSAPVHAGAARHEENIETMEELTTEMLLEEKPFDVVAYESDQSGSESNSSGSGNGGSRGRKKSKSHHKTKDATAAIYEKYAASEYYQTPSTAAASNKPVPVTPTSVAAASLDTQSMYTPGGGDENTHHGGGGIEIEIDTETTDTHTADPSLDCGDVGVATVSMVEDDEDDEERARRCVSPLGVGGVESPARDTGTGLRQRKKGTGPEGIQTSSGYFAKESPAAGVVGYGPTLISPETRTVTGSFGKSRTRPLQPPSQAGTYISLRRHCQESHTSTITRILLVDDHYYTCIYTRTHLISCCF